MSLSDHSKKFFDIAIANEVREIKKEVPFQINTIGNATDLKAWKAEREAQEAIWQAKRAKKVQRIARRLQANEIFDQSGLGLSEATKKYKALVDKNDSFIPVPGKIYTYYEKPSLLKRLVTKALVAFLDIKFQ